MQPENHTQFTTHIQKLGPDLHRYLPGSQTDALLAQPDLATLRPCNDHLDALLRAVSTYLPRYLVAEQLADPVPGQVGGQFREATIMFADISGFTAMSERLSLQGEKGAEKITNIVGDYFTAMLDITTRHGGDLLKFGGDALLVAFLGDNDPVTVDHIVDACHAAAEMQQAIARFSQVEAFGEIFRLKMTVGLGSGFLFTANLGTAEKMEYTVMGEALANMAFAEDQAEGGEIFIDENSYQAVKDQITVGDIRNGCYQVTEVRGTSQPGPILSMADVLPNLKTDDVQSQLAHLQQTTTCLNALVSFLPPGLLELLRFDPLHMASREKGEFRPVTTIFANFYGIDEIIKQLGPSQVGEITAILDAHFTKMQEIIHRYEGVIDKVDSYVTGHRIMALFGAPRAHVDDPERAVRAALEMQAAMSTFAALDTSAGTFALRQRIGINSGRVFAGNVGSETRHEYSVMGDEVNLTARLMSAAQEDQILISQSTANQAGKGFRLGEKEPVQVKGKSQPVPNYEVLGIIKRQQTGELIHRSPLIGRNDEWQTIWQVAQHTFAGQCQVVDIHGEMGMGKSRIIEELIDRWTQRGGISFFTACLSYGRHTPYAPWNAVLRDLFGLRDDDSDQERREKITGRLTAVNPEWIDWAALVANLLSVPMDESDLLRSLDPQLRQQNLQRIIAGVIISEADYHPTLLVLDDVQWIDETSLSLLNYVSAHIGPHPLLICVAYRPEEQIELATCKQPICTAVSLEALPEHSSLDLLQSQLPTEPEMPQRLQDIILKNAQGNPLFIVEMAHALIENYMSYDAQTGVYRARQDLDRVQVPDTVSRVILSRLDRLDEQSRNMLKVASAIGRAFQQWLLQSVYPYQTNTAEMEARLLELVQKEILDRAASGGQTSLAEIAYLYRHVMTREVAYESLLYAERRDLHSKIAQSIEAQRDAHLDEYLEVLAEHYTLAEEWPRALPHHIKAAQRAQAVYANQDAIHRYRQALQVAEHVPDSREEQIVAYEGLGDTYELTGQYTESLESYAQARTVLKLLSPTLDIQRHRADLCRKTGLIHDRRGEYNSALEWVDRGLGLVGTAACIETARLYLGGASVFQREGQWKRVIEWCQLSLDITATLDTKEARQVAAHAYRLLGNSYRRLGETEKVRHYYERSLETYQELSDQPGIAHAFSSLATFYRYLDDWPRATDYYQQALAILKRIGELRGQAVISNNLAELMLNRGNLKSARIWYLQSLSISKELGLNFGVALVNNNLGYTAIRGGKWQRALDHLQQSLDMFEKIGSEEFLPELYRHLAEAHLGQGDVEQAQDWAQKSLSRALAADIKLEEGCTRRVLGCIYRTQEDVHRAQTELEQSLHVLDDLQSPYQVAQTAIELAALYDDLQEGEQASRLRQQAIETFERLGAKLDLEQAKSERQQKSSDLD
ncbi:MAG: tetratricopeptide repeat protein [Anaerolineae bacterium]|nr:tetratricopeptide repeat protein [Anaerolineae bacterium]